MIINVRGTTGSGKSTVMRAVLSHFGGRPIYGVLGNRWPEAYCLCARNSVHLLGPYTTHPKAGMDWIESVDGSIQLINKYLDRGSVLLEGYLLSRTYGRLGEFLATNDSQFILLTTPADVCATRVANRRLGGRGRGASWSNNNTANIVASWDSVERIFRKFEDAGAPTLRASQEDAVTHIVERLR